MGKRIDWNDLQNKIMRHFWIDHKGLFCRRHMIRIEGYKNSTVGKALTKLKREKFLINDKIYWGLSKTSYADFKEGRRS